MPMTAALLWLYNESKTKKDMGSISAYNFMRLLCIRGGRTVLVQGARTGGHNDRRTTTGSADCEFRADGITDKDKFHTADIFSGCGSDFGGRRAVSPIFSGTAAGTYRGQLGDYLLYS